MLEDFSQHFLRRFPKIHIHFLPARRHLGDCLFSELIMPDYLTVRRTPALTELLSSVMSHLSSEPSRTSAGGKHARYNRQEAYTGKKNIMGLVEFGVLDYFFIKAPELLSLPPV